MTDRELIQRSLSHLHASDGTLEEVLRMIERDKKKTGRIVGRIALIALAAALVLGGTALAVSAYRLHGTQVGDYAVTVGVETEETAQAQATYYDGETGLTTSQPKAKPIITATWLPEGMTLQPTDSTEYYYTDDDGNRIMIYPTTMDVAADQVQIGLTGITYWEELSIGGNSAIYVEQQREFGSWFYLYLIRDGYVLEISGRGVSQEDVIRFAEGLELEEGLADVDGLAQNWSEYVRISNTSASEEISVSETGEVPAETVENAHGIGEAFTVEAHDDNYYSSPDLTGSTLTVKVVSVELADDVSALDPAYVPSSDNWQNAVNEDGTLGTNVISYYTQGDGVNTLPELGLTEEVGLKLLTATVEYTNDSDEALDMVLINGMLLAVEETEDGYVRYDYNRAASKGYDYMVASCAFDGLMDYYDVRSSLSTSGPNYIDHLEPGETVTVHMAWLVNEDEVDMLYLSPLYYGTNNVCGINDIVDIWQ